MRICKADDCDNDVEAAGRRTNAVYCSDLCRVKHKDWNRNVHQTAQLPLRVSHDLKERIVAEAEARNVTQAWLVTKLIEEGMANLIPASEFSLTRANPQGDRS